MGTTGVHMTQHPDLQQAFLYFDKTPKNLVIEYISYKYGNSHKEVEVLKHKIRYI
jgi:hypothetical protein